MAEVMSFDDFLRRAAALERDLRILASDLATMDVRIADMQRRNLEAIDYWKVQAEKKRKDALEGYSAEIQREDRDA